MKNIIVIHHSADFDGLFCLEIARKRFGAEATYIGWDYGDPVPEVPPEAVVYMLDISIAELMNHAGLIWIDHHKSAIEKYNPAIAGVRIDGVAACRLAWQYFFGDGLYAERMKDHFFYHMLSEPLAVRLAGEYDIWDKRDPRAELFQHGLRSCDLSNAWSLLLAIGRKPSKEELAVFTDTGYEPNMLEFDGTITPAIVHGLLENGRSIQYAKTKENEATIRDFGFTAKFEGLTFLCCNTARYNSHLFTAGIQPEHDGLLGFNWTGKEWRISLYGVPGKPDIDLSKIAVKYGGGGHKQACGFKSPVMPFQL